MRGYKVKIYPSKRQKEILMQNMGACRFVWNYFLALKKETYLTMGKNITYNAMSKELTKLRRETEWMKDVQHQPMQQSLRCLDVAYNNFFRGKAKFPNFKKKNGKNSMKKVNGWSIDGNKINVMQNMSIRFCGTFPKEREGTLTISRDPCGDWWASTIAGDKRKQPKLKNKVLGVDVGLKELVTTSDGDKFGNLKICNSFAKKIKTASQSLAKKQKGSNRRNKVKRELARLHRKASNIRNNHLHHVSKAVVSKNHATIAMEDLAVANMMKNRRLARSIGDASWGELMRQISYKQEWQGGNIVKVGRFFPSSKTCHSCHFVISSLPLSVREWQCPKCLTEHDRNVNAARMIAQQAGEQLGVESTQNSSRTRPSVKVSGSSKRGYVQG